MQTKKTESDSNNAVHIGKDAVQSVIVAGDGNSVNFSSSDHESQNPSPQPSPQEGRGRKQDAPAWVLKVSVGNALAFLIILMVLAVFIPEPKPFQIFVFRVVLSLAAAGFGATIPGFLKIDLPLWGKGLISAGGAIALFVVVYKVNPPELIHQQPPPPIEQKMKQPLSGIVLDEKGNPLSGVVVSLSDFSIAKTTNEQGAFSFEVEAEKQTSVRLMAQKPGFMTWRQDVTLGNTSLSFRLEKP